MSATFKTVRLTNEEAAATGYTHKWVITAADLVAAGETTGATLELHPSVPADSKIENIDWNLVTAFDGGATTELTMKLGYDLSTGSDDDDAFLAATSLHADSTPVYQRQALAAAIDSSTIDTTFGQQEADVLTSLRTEVDKLLARGPRFFNVGWSFEAVFTATTANLSALTVGEVHLYARIVQLGTDGV